MDELLVFPTKVRHYLENELGPVSAFLPEDEMSMNKYKAICLDLDGTVYRGTEPIPEAVSFIGKIQENGIDPYFITNNSSMTRVQVQRKTWHHLELKQILKEL